ncbi:hypothetical protein IHC39_002748 [Enterococcus faecalis]|uniref:hypothetical protein n=1 Tax=Enterococcus TaxID=1350 RepID=UPI00033068DD|nr:hypothetical protein [Enterococcus faecalis]EGO2586806.1 hypothetical protein [Enterococcus faecalis]EGO2588145.1 hypothetical protein [Enterococcus faecalis]EGO5850450.1 hypothetical protein [Enterococcus faecalis]EJI7260793.1 hypothetical protein [Enterococcus faecalis]EOJ53980.1 hypothetical protein WMI_02150 [Enterococcus faecalis EnGen0363]
MEDKPYFVDETINLETDLYLKTKLLYKEMTTTDISDIPIIDFRLSEIYSLRDKLDLFLKIKFELQHYELTSLISFWDRTFQEMKEIVENGDSNKSYLVGEFENYQDEHEIVDEMLKNYSNSINK